MENSIVMNLPNEVADNAQEPILESVGALATDNVSDNHSEKDSVASEGDTTIGGGHREG